MKKCVLICAFNFLCWMGVVQYMVAPRQGQLQYYRNTGVPWKNNIGAVITSGRVIDNNLKSEIKIRALNTCRLFPLLPTPLL